MQSEVHQTFISYSWDSDLHKQRVLSLAQVLRANGVDAWVDAFETPHEEWPLWCYRQIDGARFVLVVCTEVYRRRVMREDEPGKGRGATWEGAILTNDIYERTHGQDKFIPVVFSGSDVASVPFFLRGYSVYDLSDQESLTDLYARLTGQRRIIPEPIGNPLKLSATRLATALPIGTSSSGAPSAPPSGGATATSSPAPTQVSLASVIEGDWVVDVANPAGGMYTMRVRLSKSVLGKRRFEAKALVGIPGWQGAGTWELLPPGNRIALTGTQMAAPYQMGVIQESYTFTVVSRTLLQGFNASGMETSWRRQ